MGNSSYFNKLLTNIEPSKTTKSYVSSIQTNLRGYLKEHKTYKTIHVDTFLSGSYAKDTSIRPSSDDEMQDVDIIVIVNHTKETPPSTVLNELYEVVKSNKKYSDSRIQSKSIGIDMSSYHIDVVPIIEIEDNYYIGDSKTEQWLLTNPKEHLNWTTEINEQSGGKFKPIIKIFKWWRKQNMPEGKKYPKGISLEAIIAKNLGNSKYDMENLLLDTMKNIVQSYKTECCEKDVLPIICDPAIKENNLLAGYTIDDFKSFISALESTLSTVSESNEWSKVFGKTPQKDVSELQNEFFDESKIQVKALLDEICKKQDELTLKIKENEEVQKKLDRRETDIQSKIDNYDNRIAETKYDLYMAFIGEIRNLDSQLFKEVGNDFWLKIVSELESINKRIHRSFNGGEYWYLSIIYKKLELYHDFYRMICKMVRAKFYLSIYDVQIIIEKTPYRSTLKEYLIEVIIPGDNSSRNLSFINALDLLNKH